jgi:iron-sulfur cluster repair protein YtfE (RIC family)
MIPLRTSPRGSRIEFAEPAHALADCHERIRHFVTVAVRLARSTQASPRIIVDTASTLRRYFGAALPLHERDEEDCVAPRLLEARPGRAVEHAVARMAGDHRAIDETIGELDSMWARITVRPADLIDLGEDLRAKARMLSSLYEGHLQLEEETIWPAIVEHVPDGTRRAMLRAIRERRTSETRRAGDPIR